MTASWREGRRLFAVTFRRQWTELGKVKVTARARTCYRESGGTCQRGTNVETNASLGQISPRRGA